jgi:hypothetical protein
MVVPKKISMGGKEMKRIRQRLHRLERKRRNHLPDWLTNTELQEWLSSASDEELVAAVLGCEPWEVTDLAEGLNEVIRRSNARYG